MKRTRQQSRKQIQLHEIESYQFHHNTSMSTPRNASVSKLLVEIACLEILGIRS